MGKKIFSFLILFFLIFFSLPVNVLAAPAVNSASGSFIHGQNITISGSEFGAKNPAAPLMWDNGEDKTVDSDSAVAAIYSHYQPNTSSGSTADAMLRRMRYRSFPHEGTTAPHSFSTKGLAGGHYGYVNNSPAYIGPDAENFRDVVVTIDSGAADKNIWFMSYYYRLHSLWGENPAGFSVNNDKYTVVQTGRQAYVGIFAYNDYRPAYAPETQGSGRTTTNANVHHAPDGCAPDYDTCVGYICGDLVLVNNPKYQWVRLEYLHQSDASIGLREIRIDNITMFEYIANCPNWMNNTRSISAGGYYRWSNNGTFETSSFRGYSDGDDLAPVNNSWRYFDDLYVDTTWSRVMLTNNAIYANATIIEPQIPSDWGSGSITVTVNQGKLPNGTAYLFVFDANNQVNSDGYPVTLGAGGGDTTPPAPPTGVSVS